jgi:hypothetical protein
MYCKAPFGGYTYFFDGENTTTITTMSGTIIAYPTSRDGLTTYAITNNGIWRFDGATAEQLTDVPEGISYEDLSGVFAFACENGGIYVSDVANGALYCIVGDEVLEVASGDGFVDVKATASGGVAIFSVPDDETSETLYPINANTPSGQISTSGYTVPSGGAPAIAVGELPLNVIIWSTGTDEPETYLINAESGETAVVEGLKAVFAASAGDGAILLCDTERQIYKLYDMTEQSASDVAALPGANLVDVEKGENGTIYAVNWQEGADEISENLCEFDQNENTWKFVDAPSPMLNSLNLVPAYGGGEMLLASGNANNTYRFKYFPAKYVRINGNWEKLSIDAALKDYVADREIEMGYHYLGQPVYRYTIAGTATTSSTGKKEITFNPVNGMNRVINSEWNIRKSNGDCYSSGGGEIYNGSSAGQELPRGSVILYFPTKNAQPCSMMVDMGTQAEQEIEYGMSVYYTKS